MRAPWEMHAYRSILEIARFEPTTIALVVGGLAVAGSTAATLAMKQPKMQTPGAPPSATDPAALAAAQDQQTAAAQSAGRASTILTSGLGDRSTPTLAKSALLGTS